LLAVDIRSGETRRLLVGPKGCEVTGLCFTPDNETAFVNIQHPSKGWPNAAIDGRPRSGTLALQKIGGGAIGS
jgi:secreted PhoX family phosphatase